LRLGLNLLYLVPGETGGSEIYAHQLAEGFGLPVVEAMSLGTPVLCSNAPALFELADGAALSWTRTAELTLASYERATARR
jgi:glycosyltransferase involved in cell wall biosynthesis